MNHTSPRSRSLHAVAVVTLAVAALLTAGCDNGAADGRFAGPNAPAQCPPVPQEPGPHGPLTAAVRKLVPFTPTSAVLCLYKDVPSTADPSGYTEGFSKQLDMTDATKAATLATDLNVAATRFTGGGCGSSTAEIVVAYFQDADQAIEVLIKLGGCASATNGGNNSKIANSNVPQQLMTLFGCIYPRPDAGPPNQLCGN